MDLDGTEDGSAEDPTEAPDDEPESHDAVPSGPVGDPGLMADLGISARTVLDLAPENALGEITDALGCAEVLEAVR